MSLLSDKFDFEIFSPRVMSLSEFRQDYLGNHTVPYHPLATSILTSQTQAILSEGDGDKIVRDERKKFFFLPFYSLLFTIIGRYYFFGSVRSSPVQRFSPVQSDPILNKSNLF